MTLGEIATKARALVGADTTSYPDANLLIDLNIWNLKVGSIIFESQDNSDFDDARATTYPVQTTPMVAGQRDYPIAFSENFAKLKRVDVSYDGVNAYRATPFDTGTIETGISFRNATSTDANFDQNFTKQAPAYDYAYNSIWIGPMPVAADVAAGGFIRTEWERNLTPFSTSDYTSVLTDSTVKPGFDAAFHPILAYGPAFEFATTKQLPQLAIIKPELQEWEQRIRTAYGRRDLDMRLNLQATPEVIYT